LTEWTPNKTDRRGKAPLRARRLIETGWARSKGSVRASVVDHGPNAAQDRVSVGRQAFAEVLDSRAYHV
jgi:hypothetical protein